MLRVILLLCLALASCQSATAVWPFNGERSSSSNVDYTNSINSAISSLPSYVSYIASQQQPQLLNTEGELVASTGQLGPTTEVKPSGGISHGVKGVNRNPSRNKGASQQPGQQLQDFFTSQSESMFNGGYLEQVPTNPTTLTGTLNLTDGKEKEGGIFRYIFPWRWIGNSNVAPTSADDSSVQPPAPKRSWPWFLKSLNRKHSGPQAPSTSCFCFPANFQPATVNQPTLYQTEQQQPSQPTHQQQSQTQYLNLENSADVTHIRPVEPSPDFESDGSNHVPIVVPAPSQVVNGQQQQQPQQVQQTQAVNGGSGNDLLANHRPQTSQQQQQQQTQQFIQQFQPVPVVTNFQTSPQQQRPAETGNQQTSSGQVASSN